MKLSDYFDHMFEAVKIAGRQTPSLTVLGAFFIGWMQTLIVPVQFVIAVLTVVLLVYQIRGARKKLADRTPAPPPSLETVE